MASITTSVAPSQRVRIQIDSVEQASSNVNNTTRQKLVAIVLGLASLVLGFKKPERNPILCPSVTNTIPDRVLASEIHHPNHRTGSQRDLYPG